MPTELAVEAGNADTSHAWRTVETVSYIEAFKRELIEFHAAIREDRAPRTDGADGLHDVTLCTRDRARAHVRRTGGRAERVRARAGAGVSAPAIAVANAPCSYGAFEITVGIDPLVPPPLELLDDVSSARLRRASTSARWAI